MATILNHDLGRWAATSSENWTCSREEKKVNPYHCSSRAAYNLECQARSCLQRQDRGVWAGEPLIKGPQGAKSQMRKHTFMDSPIQLELLVCHLSSCVLVY